MAEIYYSKMNPSRKIFTFFHFPVSAAELAFCAEV
jgi:hypothetical protein